MKLTKLTVKNEAGELAEMDRKDYIKFAVATYEITEYNAGDGSNPTPADKLVDFILKSIESGSDIDEGVRSDKADTVAKIEADAKLTVDNSASAKEKKEAEKAAKEKAKADEAAAKAEAEKNQLATQQGFATAVIEGASLAAAEFKSEVLAMGNALPSGVTLQAKGAGIGLVFASDATKETIGQTFGYLAQKSENSSFMNNQLQFWMGDVVRASVDRKIFPDANSAQKFLAEEIKKSTGKEYVPASIAQYKTMAERTAIEYRNVEVDMSAYLEVSKMKVPKQGDKEKDDEFKKRVASFETARTGILEQLAKGEITKRKQVQPLIEAVLVDNGIKEAVDPNAEKVSVTALLLQYFQASKGLELNGIHEPDKTIYQGKGELHALSKEALEEIKANADAQLTNILVSNEKNGITTKDIFAGFITKTTQVEVAKGADGKAIMEDKKTKVKVYPPANWFTPEETAAPEATPTETGGGEDPAAVEAGSEG